MRNALVMLVSTMRWRALELKVDSDIMVNGEALAHRQVAAAGVDAAEKKEAADFLHQMRCGKGFIHGVDRYNRPVAVIRAHLHKPFGQSASSLERFIVYLFETASLMMPPRVESAVCMPSFSFLCNCLLTIADVDFRPEQVHTGQYGTYAPYLTVKYEQNTNTNKNRTTPPSKSSSKPSKQTTPNVSAPS